MKKPGQPSRGEPRPHEDAELFSSRDFGSEEEVSESSHLDIAEPDVPVKEAYIDSEPAELFSEEFSFKPEEVITILKSGTAEQKNEIFQKKESVLVQLSVQEYEGNFDFLVENFGLKSLLEIFLDKHISLYESHFIINHITQFIEAGLQSELKKQADAVLYLNKKDNAADVKGIDTHYEELTNIFGKDKVFLVLCDSLLNLLNFIEPVAGSERAQIGGTPFHEKIAKFIFDGIKDHPERSGLGEALLPHLNSNDGLIIKNKMDQLDTVTILAYVPAETMKDQLDEFILGYGKSEVFESLISEGKAFLILDNIKIFSDEIKSHEKMKDRGGEILGFVSDTEISTSELIGLFGRRNVLEWILERQEPKRIDDIFAGLLSVDMVTIELLKKHEEVVLSHLSIEHVGQKLPLLTDIFGVENVLKYAMPVLEQFESEVLSHVSPEIKAKAMQYANEHGICMEQALTQHINQDKFAEEKQQQDNKLEYRKHLVKRWMQEDPQSSSRTVDEKVMFIDTFFSEIKNKRENAVEKIKKIKEYKNKEQSLKKREIKKIFKSIRKIFMEEYPFFQGESKKEKGSMVSVVFENMSNIMDTNCYVYPNVDQIGRKLDQLHIMLDKMILVYRRVFNVGQISMAAGFEGELSLAENMTGGLELVEDNNDVEPVVENEKQKKWWNIWS
jgi:hypothetical protein